MSGHSKWSTIKRQKGVTDVRRAQVFTKLAREIAVAARQGGTDPNMNVHLRLAVQRARDSNMPLDNIERAIKRGGGEDGDQKHPDPVIYEGYGPGGAAILLHALTDNRNRTAAEVRNVFARGGGNLGETGCVAWTFEQKGVISIKINQGAAEELALVAIDAGAEDFKQDDDELELYTDLENFESVRRVLEEHQLSILSAELSMLPKVTTLLESKAAEGTLRLLDKLEELDDVSKVYTNADFPEEVLERYRGE